MITNKPKGGPLARLSGLLCANPKFQQFVGATGQDQAAEAIRARCQVKSRAELDHNKDAAIRFHEIFRRPFAESQEQMNAQDKAAHDAEIEALRMFRTFVQENREALRLVAHFGNGGCGALSMILREELSPGGNSASHL